MASFETLPYDLIYHIFSTDYISFSDLLQLSSVCQAFNCVASSNGLWRSKFKKRWPHSDSLFLSTSEDWKTLFKWRYYCELKVRQKLSELTTDCYHVENIEPESMQDLYEAVEKYCYNFRFILDELDIFRTSERENHLCEKFYADRVWRGMKIMSVMMSCKKYIEQPESFSLLEGAMLATNWFEHFEFAQVPNTKKAVRELAILALQRLRLVYPEHPAVARYKRRALARSRRRGMKYEKQSSPSDLTIKSKPLLESVWGTIRCQQVLESIHKTMFGYLNFQIANTDSDSFTINKAVKGRGTKELIAITFAAVASYLGVLVEPLTMKGIHIQLLKWKPHSRKNPGEVYYLVAEDIWDSKNSDFIFEDCIITDDNEEPIQKELEYKPLLVFTLLVSKTIRFHYQSFFMHYTHLRVALSHLNIVLRFLRSYQAPRAKDLYHIIFRNLSVFLLNVHDIQPKTLVCRIQSKIPNEAFPERHKYRYRAKYAIGMIMRHKWELYRCVIYSWDDYPTEEWCELFDIEPTNQPYYRVLLDDDIVQYVAEDDLEIDDQKTPIRSIKVGKYFKSFRGSYYKPNEIAQSVYPDDKSIQRTWAL